MAELKVVSQGTQTISFNYEELKAELMAKTMEYEGAVYSVANIGDAKADRARLNKLKTALNDERLKREKEFMLPFMGFKAQVNELIKIIERPISAIDEQIKAVEENERLEKKGDCVEVFASIPHPDWLDYEQIESPKWYNKTTALSTVKKEITERVAQIESDLKIIKDVSPDYVTSLEYYKLTLNLQDSLAEGKRAKEIEAKKEQMKRESAPLPNTEEEEMEWVTFKAHLTPTKARWLAVWLRENGIEFKKGE